MSRVKTSSKQSNLSGQQTILKVKVIANAPKTQVVEWMGDVLKIKIKAQPQENAANKALVEYLAKQLKINKGKIHILSGAKSPLKMVSIEGVVSIDFSKIFRLNDSN